jgi:hypothetical protein
MAKQLDASVEKSGAGDLQALLNGNDTWIIA